MRLFMAFLLALSTLSFHALAGDAAAQADFEFACAAEIKNFKAAYPSVPRAEWLDQAWEQRFVKFREPPVFFHEMKSETDPRKLAYYTLLACGSVTWLEQQKSGVGSGAKARERWLKAMASFKERLAAERRGDGKGAGQVDTPGDSPKKPTVSVATGRWPAGVEPGNLYLAKYGPRGFSSIKHTVLVSAKTKSEAVALMESKIREENGGRQDAYALGLIEVSESAGCNGPNWGATVSMNTSNSSNVTASVCGARTPREAISRASALCARELGRPCRLGRDGDYHLSVSIGHSGARPWGGLKDGFGGPHLGGFPSPAMSFVALGASTQQSSPTNQYIQSPEDAIDQFGKACGASLYGRDTHSCWITSKNLGCVWNNNGQAMQDDSYQRKCVDTKLTADGYLP